MQIKYFSALDKTRDLRPCFEYPPEGEWPSFTYNDVKILLYLISTLLQISTWQVRLTKQDMTTSNSDWKQNSM